MPRDTRSTRSEPKLELQAALEVFGRSFALGRSLFYPAEFVDLGGIFAVRDILPRKGNPRSTEFFSVDKPPEEVLDALRLHASGSHFLCDVVTEESAIHSARAEYKKAGFRALRTERIMAAHLLSRKGSPFPSDFPVRRVSTESEIEQIKAFSGRRPLRPEHLAVDDSPMRCYYACDQDLQIGWATSIRAGAIPYVSGMYVRESYRRRGVGRAVLDCLMCDDRRLGAEWSVLVANKTGAMLYPHLGYETVGYLQVLAPPRALSAP